jgi:hypothetical protein
MGYFERQYDLVIEESRMVLEMEPNLVLAYFQFRPCLLAEEDASKGNR